MTTKQFVIRFFSVSLLLLVLIGLFNRIVDPFWYYRNGRLKGVNFALAGAPWAMVLCNFEFAATHAPIKRALIGFHPDNMPQVNCKKDFAKLGQINMGELLLSMPSLRASIKTIRKLTSKATLEMASSLLIELAPTSTLRQTTQRRLSGRRFPYAS